jgi:HrpA-like RNA helicase
MKLTPHLPEIVGLIRTAPIVEVVAPTGSGKSLLIPAALAALGTRCFITVPTRNAAISLAEYQKMLQRSRAPEGTANQRVGSAAEAIVGYAAEAIVGYAAEGNVQYGPSTTIAYITAGHGRRKMLSYFRKGTVSPIDFCDVLMVDEFHAGSLDTTAIVALWMAAAEAGVAVPRLVIASATPVPLSLQPSPVTFAPDFPVPSVQYHYHTQDLEVENPSGTVLADTARRVIQIHRETPVESGHILVFAPGSREVETIAEHVTSGLSDTDNYLVVPAFSSLTREQVEFMYSTVEAGRRKIVVATNIAEMSITIEGVGHVVDTMLEKRAETAKSGGLRLGVYTISRASATQRAGRTGRTMDGHYYPMISAAQYRKLEEHRPPEINRVPCYNIIMELMEVGLVPKMVLKDIHMGVIESAVQLLSRLGMVGTASSVCEVTKMGHFAPHFPLAVRNSAFLWHWISGGYPIFPGLVVAVMIDCYGPSYYWVPRKRFHDTPDQYAMDLRDYKQQRFSDILGDNDVETALNLWSAMMTHFSGIPNVTDSKLSQWAYACSYNHKKLREVVTILGECIHVAQRLGYKVVVGPFTPVNVVKAARPILKTVYSDTVMTHRYKTQYRSALGEVYRLDSRETVNSFTTIVPTEIIALATAEIAHNTTVMRVISFAIDTERSVVPKQSISIRSNTAPIRAKPTAAVAVPESAASDVDREYLRYQCVQRIIETVTRMSAHPYEALNCIERWLLTLANADSGTDPIFTAAVSDTQAPVHATVTRELLEKNMANAPEIVTMVRKLATEYLATPVPIAPVPQREENGVLTVGTFRSTMSPGRLDLLLKSGTLTQVARMTLRYACLLHRGQQWSLPPKFHRLVVEEYGATLEAFASPINTQILAINPTLKFCSVFPDTDAVFGSVGSFFAQTLDQMVVIANPPFVNDLMEAMVDKIAADLETATNLRVFITVPYWADAPYYHKLTSNVWLRKSIFLARGTHSYVDMSSGTTIPAMFNSCVFIVSKGYPEIDYEAAAAAVIAAME